MKPLRARFGADVDRLAESYGASISFDRRLYRQDIVGSIAHCRMLARQGIIGTDDAQQIVDGLKAIEGEIERGEFPFREELEDIHMNIEARLKEMIGEVAGRLHTARSRNDQVAVDLRLFVKECIPETVVRIRQLQKALVDVAARNEQVAIPGYTHLQRAQPILFAHHLLAYFEMLERDVSRFEDALRRADVLPLGSGALAGVTYPIDRESVAQELGFASVSRNSLDSVSDRDFVVDYVAAAALTMMHLSRLGEEIVLWSTTEFGFIELSDSYSTSSSMMPQKKNPDFAELIRGKTGRVYGDLTALLTLLKGQPLAYNKDLQEDKEALFDAVDTLLPALAIFAGMIGTMRVKTERAAQAAADPLMLATDIADYLVRKGLPFRGAYSVVGALVHHCAEKGISLTALTLADYQSFSPAFGEDILSVSLEQALSARNATGGTAPSRVHAELERVRGVLGENERT
ncbi:MAG: argininosuccinate lyase [Chloroflexota bacterium]|nr:MAG: argininosuccinate lyase [Chloroflexota bacterium]